ncbi:GNAT family N-acetyltransferase [Bosea sp. NBC_00550]|uniref:GNAT family N-acetyltransferase n=1 Tax=Bosea sp. NBC_00550 TaxID=2969621 RepID=UPI00222E7D67|nr:GNAT family N-acetyltransferase [Bosea sp. NBC_00550]UZF92492.1 GNAT family N-acetyltransferase [Bosea sp. NBC_00550]
MSDIIIRPLTAADRAAWTPLWRGYLTFYKATLPPELDAVTFDRLTGGQEPMGGFIAMRGDEALGMTNWVIHRSTWSERNICYLQDLFTVPEARGTGVGRKLIEAVNEMARAKNCFRVYWQTHESNLQAQELYNKVADKSGFIVYRQPLA